MPKSIHEVAEEMKGELQLPDGYWIKVDTQTDNILIGTDELAFCVTRAQIDDNLHICHAKESLPNLKLAIQQFHNGTLETVGAAMRASNVD